MTKANILIVEDDSIVAEDIRNTLERLGYFVQGITAYGEDAVKKAGKDKPDLVLMDIVLKGKKSGTDAAGEIRSRFGIPVVYLTAYADEKILERAKAAQPFGYIIKPFGDRELNIGIEMAIYKHRMEMRLQESREWFQTTLNSIGDAVIATDKDGNVLFMNPVAESLTAWSQEEATGKDLTEVFHIINEKTRERCKNPVRKVLETGTIVGLANNTVLISKQGKEYIIADSGSPIRNSEGQIIGVVMVFRDVTEETCLRDQLQQARKMESIGTLTAGIAHDFNNILGIIIGNTELALDDVPERNPAHFNLEEIRTASLRAKDIIRQLLSFSRKTDPEKKPTDPAPVIKESLKLLRSSLPAIIDIRQDIPNEVGTILADPTQLCQIMINMGTNAVHAMQDTGGILEVRLNDADADELKTIPGLPAGNYIRLKVSDTGAGISSEIRDRIYDPYFTTKEVGKGTGMGLSIVHGIVKSHGGSISVESAPGKGTTFRIFFPAFKGEAKTESETKAKPPTGNEKILFIDDEKSATDMVGMMLSRLGYDAEISVNPVSALEIFRSDPDSFDLIITDMTMPQMTGDQLAQDILAIRPDVPVIICTGFSERMSEQISRDVGIRKYIQKPFNMHEIAVAIREVLDGNDKPGRN